MREERAGCASSTNATHSIGQLPRLIEQGTDNAGRPYLVISIPPGTGETRAFTSKHERFLAALGKARFRSTEFEHAAKCQWIPALTARQDASVERSV